jgi:hypothetical protein
MLGQVKAKTFLKLKQALLSSVWGAVWVKT